MLSSTNSDIITGCYDGKLYKINSERGAIEAEYQTGDQIKATPHVDPLSGNVWVKKDCWFAAIYFYLDWLS
jgi:hypothetical protein